MEELLESCALIRCGRDYVRFFVAPDGKGSYRWRADIRQRTMYGALPDAAGFQNVSAEADSLENALVALSTWTRQRGVRLAAEDLAECARAVAVGLR
jgi:hypothetical protein